MKKLLVLSTLLIIISFTIFSCGASKKVQRIDTDTTVDLSGKWNDTDSRLVSQAMITDCMNHPWIIEHTTKSMGKRPTVIVGSMRNRSSEHIAMNTFMNDIERAFINSGRVNVVASATQRGELRSEKDDQRVNASLDTIKEMGRELGADYMMTGEINTILDQEGGKKVMFYQIDLTLTNVESNIKIWLGQHKIKKFITQSRYSS